MSIRIPLIVSLLIIAVMVAMSAYAWAVLPDAPIAMHFTVSGTANGFGDKAHALLIPLAAALGLVLVLSIIPRIEPRRFNLAASAKFYNAAWIGAIALLAVVHACVIMRAMHMPVNIGSIMPVAMGLLWVVIGNYMSKTRSNFFAGIRTPWTLSSDYSWGKTHRLTGWLFVAVGLAGIVTTFVARAAAMHVLLAGTIGSALVGIVASYAYWRRDPERHAGDSAPV